ncbi:MAG: SusF/SusE family outer membrane protein [Prevotella sp.]|nr:SusF/SusE family outer membrane protein [Prevotella sp.]
MSVRRVFLPIICLLVAIPSLAQDFNELWATGSAVPDGTCQLVKRPDGQFRFAGALNQGELKIMTTETFQKGVTQFLKPQLVDSYLINKGLNYVITSDESQPGWVVSFQEDAYRFLVDPASRKVTGELMLPWNEVFIAGSAFEGGANHVEWNRNGMLPFERDHDNPYVFSWTGELGEFGGVVEPGRFKLEGQMTWGPRELHPYVQDEDLLSSTQMRQGGDDTKWHVYIPGTYHIVVDLFNETFHAELIAGANTYETDGVDGIEGTSDGMPTAVYNMGGVRMPSLQKGLNIVRTADGKVRKIYCK